MFPSVLSVVKSCDCSSEKAKKHYREKMAFSQSSSVSAYRVPRFLEVARTVKPQVLQIRKLMTRLEEQNKGRQIG
jgi:hypothetical protein